MKKVFKIFLIAISLIFCITALTSCGPIFNMKNTAVLSANFVKNDIYFTNDITDDELRQQLTVLYEVKIFDIFGIEKEISDYDLSYDSSEGYNKITVSYNEKSVELHALFVDKDKLSYEGDFVFCEIKGDDYLLEYRGNATELVLPERDPYIIYHSVFRDNQTIKSVKLGDSVKQIGSGAFAYTKIESIDIGSGLESICASAFSGSNCLRYLNVSSVEQWCNMKFRTGLMLTSPTIIMEDGTVIEGIYVIEGLETQLGQSFIYGSGILIASFDAASTTEEDGFLFFWDENGELIYTVAVDVSNPVYFTKSIHVGGEKLEHLVVPENVTGVSEGFAGSDIKSVSIHKNVISITSGAFEGCDQLEKIDIEDVNEALINRYAKIFDEKCKAITELNDIRYIGNETNPYLIAVGLSDKEVIEITTHNDTKAIAARAFEIEDSRIQKVVLSDSVEYVGEYFVKTEEYRFHFTAGANLRYIGRQRWFDKTIVNGNAVLEIGDLSRWYFTNADGEKIAVTDKGDIIAEDRISKDIFREPSSDE